MSEFLGKLDNEVKREVLKFVLDRYGYDKEWKEKMFGVSKESICRIYFKEFVNWWDERRW